MDESKGPRDVHWLDLAESQPKPVTGKSVIHTQNKHINDMCFVQDGDKQLLVVAAADEGLFAYNTGNDEVEWKVDGCLFGNRGTFESYGSHYR